MRRSSDSQPNRSCKPVDPVDQTSDAALLAARSLFARRRATGEVFRDEPNAYEAPEVYALPQEGCLQTRASKLASR
jgi:hypothetical protein